MKRSLFDRLAVVKHRFTYGSGKYEGNTAKEALAAEVYSIYSRMCDDPLRYGNLVLEDYGDLIGYHDSISSTSLDKSFADLSEKVRRIAHHLDLVKLFKKFSFDLDVHGTSMSHNATVIHHLLLDSDINVDAEFLTNRCFNRLDVENVLSALKVLGVNHEPDRFYRGMNYILRHSNNFDNAIAIYTSHIASRDDIPEGMLASLYEDLFASAFFDFEDWHEVYVSASKNGIEIDVGKCQEQLDASIIDRSNKWQADRFILSVVCKKFIYDVITPSVMKECITRAFDNLPEDRKESMFDRLPRHIVMSDTALKRRLLATEMGMY